MASIRTVRTITDSTPLIRDPKNMGLSLGSQIDNRIMAAIEANEVLQTIALEFEESDWHELAHQVMSDPRRAERAASAKKAY